MLLTGEASLKVPEGLSRMLFDWAVPASPTPAKTQATARAILVGLIFMASLS
jgi:hypothetical protein